MRWGWERYTGPSGVREDAAGTTERQEFKREVERKIVGLRSEALVTGVFWSPLEHLVACRR